MNESMEQVAAARIDVHLGEMKRRYWRDTDHLFAGLMLFQLVSGIAMAIIVSPYTWIGATPKVHLHIWSAIGLGTMLSALPMFLAWQFPGETLTRHVVAVSQMLWSALLIHLSGGRIETHFHVFGSLAFIAFYRDWKVLLTATVIVAADHFVRGVYYPQSVFGVLVESPFRWIEHAAWVVFEDFVLVLSCIRGNRDMREVCRRRVLLEQTNERIEQTIERRTMELRQSNKKLSMEISERKSAQARENQLGRIVEQSVNEVYVFDAKSLKIHEVNQSALCNLGYTTQEILSHPFMEVAQDLSEDEVRKILEPLLGRRGVKHTMQIKHYRKDGSTYPTEINMQAFEWDGRAAFVVIGVDITERRKAETERNAIQKQLVESSRMAGMAEIATGVLHNVGNVLNSVNVSASLLQEQVRKSRTSNLERVAGLLSQHEADLGTFMTSDQRGKMLPCYLSELSKTVSQEREEMLAELNSLTSNISHVKDIVQTQQAYAKISGSTEVLPLIGIIEEALKVEQVSLERHQIRVVRDYQAEPTLKIDKHKLIQILVNLIGNAKQAITEHGGPEHQITIRTLFQDKGTVAIECIDNGGGIDLEHIDRIFNHGFTTRKNGHGFGLHSSANAATELEGSLAAESDGIGKGATFRILLPVNPESDHDSPNVTPVDDSTWVETDVEEIVIAAVEYET